MTARYFSPDLTLDEIKAEYRRLCKLYHPDLTTDEAEKIRRTVIMQNVNAEYTVASASARRTEEPARRAKKQQPEPTEAEYQNMADVDERVRAAIERIIRFGFLEIEICGQWVWVDGTAKRGTSAENDEALDSLMTSGYKWASQKKRWYFAGVPAGHHWTPWSMDDIRNAHGSVKVRTGKAKDEERTAEKKTAALPQ